MSVQGPIGQKTIGPSDQDTTPLKNVSGVKEHKPPMFLKTISNKLKRGFNNLVLSHNKRVVKRAYVKQKSCNKKDYYLHGGHYNAAKQQAASNFNNCSSLETTKLTKKELKALYSVLKNDQGFRDEFFKTRREQFCPIITQRKLDAVNELNVMVQSNLDTSNELNNEKSIEIQKIKDLMVATGFSNSEDLEDVIKGKFQRINIDTLREEKTKIEKTINRNKTFFNNLPMEAKKAFIEQNKGDVEFLSTFSNVYKEELLKPDNKELLAALPGDKQVQFCKTNDLDHRDYLDLNNHEVAQAFVKEYEEALLNPDNKTFFNSLPIEAKKAFIEQNKDDVEFLSTFSNVYKEELLNDPSLCIKTVLTFKDVIKKDEKLFVKLNKDIHIISNKTINKLKSENLQQQQAFIDMFKDNDEFVAAFIEMWKDDLMKNPSCVSFLSEDIKSFISNYNSNNSFFNENNVKTFINNNKTDDISMNCLFVLFNEKFQQNTALLKEVVRIMANPDSNTLELLLKKQDKPSLLPDQQKEIYNYLKGNNNIENIKNIQILRDIDRDYTIDFVGPDGGKVEFRNIDGQDKTKVLENVKSQAKNLSEKDITALIDFMNYCPAQGLISAHPSGMTAFQVPFFGDGKPHINVNYDKSGGIDLKMQFKGSCTGAVLSLCDKLITFNDINNTNNEIVFSYKKSLKEKMSEVKVTCFSQDATEIKELF